MVMGHVNLGISRLSSCHTDSDHQASIYFTFLLHIEGQTWQCAHVDWVFHDCQAVIDDAPM